LRAGAGGGLGSHTDGQAERRADSGRPARRTDRLRDRWTDSRVDGRADGRVRRQMGRQMHGQADRQTDGQAEGGLVAGANGLAACKPAVWTDRQTDRQTDGWSFWLAYLASLRGSVGAALSGRCRVTLRDDDSLQYKPVLLLNPLMSHWIETERLTPGCSLLARGRGIRGWMTVPRQTDRRTDRQTDRSNSQMGVWARALGVFAWVYWCSSVGEVSGHIAQ
jgi:hypothetical protein